MIKFIQLITEKVFLLEINSIRLVNFSVLVDKFFMINRVNGSINKKFIIILQKKTKWLLLDTSELYNKYYIILI